MEELLFYEKHGQSKKTLIFFHGFGQNTKALSPWVNELSHCFTIYNFDLYYHGKSNRKNKPLQPNHWKEDFESFLEQEGIDSFSLVAFSLGGRFALATYSLFPNRINHLVLVAPDGIYKSIWFKLAVSKWGNPLFKHLMHHPSHFNKGLNILEKSGLAKSQMIRFARKELSGVANKKRVYSSWTHFNPLQPDIDLIKNLATNHKTPIHVILGESDHIIPAKDIRSKLSDFKTVQYHLLPLKHHQLIEGAKSLIPSFLQEDNL